jgi:hypothetical protein
VAVCRHKYAQSVASFFRSPEKHPMQKKKLVTMPLNCSYKMSDVSRIYVKIGFFRVRSSLWLSEGFEEMQQGRPLPHQFLFNIVKK